MRKFDTGGSTPIRTLVEDGVEEILSPLVRANGGYLHAVIPVGVVVRSWTDEIGIEMLMRAFTRTPAIGFATGSRSFQSMNVQRSDFSSDLQLILYFASQHSRDPRVGRMASDKVSDMDGRVDPGINVAMAHALELLIGQYPTTMSGIIKQMIPDREDELTTIPEITIWKQEYQITTFNLKPKTGNATQWRSAAQLLESIQWRITRDENDPNRPAAAVSETAIDTNSNLEP